VKKDLFYVTPEGDWPGRKDDVFNISQQGYEFSDFLGRNRGEGSWRRFPGTKKITNSISMNHVEDEEGVSERSVERSVLHVLQRRSLPRGSVFA